MPEKRYPDSALGAASFAFPVAPDDDADLPGAKLPRALYIGTGGDLVVRLADDPDTDITFKNVGDGQLLDIQPIRVMEATTALDIVALA